ncbi:MAG: hypothetical protein AAFZ91_11900 [Pseudomonadota bacterium]
MALGVAKQIENPQVIPENAHITREPSIYLPRDTLCREDGSDVGIYGPRIVGDQLCGSDRYVHPAEGFDWEQATTKVCFPRSSFTHFITLYEGTTFGIYPMTRQSIKCPKG